MFKTIAFASALLLSAPAFAQALVDTGAPTSDYSGSAGLDGNAPEYNFDGQSLAAEVNFANGATINSIETFGYNFSFIGETTVAIYASNGTIPTGNALFSGTFNAPYTGDTTGQWMGLHDLSWTLSAGSYFVAFEAADYPNGFAGGLGTSVPNPVQGYAFSGYDGWHSTPTQIALRIDGTAGAAGAVPEPASWALMLGGFGLVGSAMRSRRRVTVAA